MRNKGEVIRNIVYFEYCGEINTKRTLELAKERCLELGVLKVVIATETGRSALKALDIFRETGIQLIAVTHFPAKTWGPKGDIPIGLMREEYSETRKKLINNGVVIVQGSRPLAPLSRYVDWNYPTPEAIIDKTLELFGAGTKIAIEVAIMATDAGAISSGEEIVSCAGTYKGLDTALVVKTTYSMNFFEEFEIKEIIAKPQRRVKKLPEFKFEGWKGDLEQYYH